MDGRLDEDSSSSDDIANATRQVPTSSAYPAKVLSRTEKRKALGVANLIVSIPSGMTLIRKFQDSEKDDPYYKDLTEETARDSDHTITLKRGKLFRKNDLAVKRQNRRK